MKHISLKTRCWTLIPALVVTALVQIGCATPAHVKPVTLAEAQADVALVYFFRPSSDAINSSDTPTLTVDGRSVAILPSSSYTEVALVPGKHRAAMVAGPSDSSNWNQSVEFEPKAGVTYYVALWHHNQPAKMPAFMEMYGATGYLIFHALNQNTAEPVVRFEAVAKDIAEFAVSGLQYVPALK